MLFGIYKRKYGKFKMKLKKKTLSLHEIFSLLCGISHDKIKKLRVDAGITQDKISEDYGISQAEMSRIESGNITDLRMSTIAKLIKIVNALKR